MRSHLFKVAKWALRDQHPAQETGENSGEISSLMSRAGSCAAVALQTASELSGNVAALLVRFPELLALVEAWPGMTEQERNAVLRQAGASTAVG